MAALSSQAAQGERFAVQLSVATPAEELRAWFDGAEPGAKAVYAAGVILPRSAEGVKLARALEESGLATLTAERDQLDHRRWRYLIVKCKTAPARPSAGTETARGRPLSDKCPRAVDRTDLRKLLSELRSRAERNRECPSLNETARLLGLPTGERGRQKANYLFRLLEQRGDISIESRGRGAARVVTILASGRAHGRRTAE